MAESVIESPTRTRADANTTTAGGVSRGAWWGGMVMGGLPSLFLVLDGAMKLAKPTFVVEGTVKVGYPERVIVPLELGTLPSKRRQLGECLGRKGFRQLGRNAWQKTLAKTVSILKGALVVDYIVLGGGNAKKLDELPQGVERGHNRNAFLGGTRLWQMDPRTRRPKWQIL